MHINLNNYSRITCDSRKVIPNSIFVAINGTHQNGNHFIEEAIKNGATLILTEERIPPHTVPIIKVKNSRQALASLSSKFYNYPSKNLLLTGITGTNGKTTTSHMLGTILKEANKSTSIIGTTGIYINEECEPSPLTTPDAEQLNKLLHDMVNKKVEHTVMEVSSQGIALNRVHNIDFDTAIYTNISHDHFDLHKFFDDYLNLKCQLFINLKKYQTAIINTDDTYSKYIINKITTPRIIKYGLIKGTQSTATNINYFEETEFIYRLNKTIISKSNTEYKPFSMKITLPTHGLHNIYNALGAISTALYYDISPPIIQKGLKNFKGVSRRFEKIKYGNYNIIDDFCHNPAGYEVVFKTLKHINYDNLYVVNAIRGNRGIEINNEIAKTLGKWSHKLPIKKIYLTSSEDVVSNKDKVSLEEKNIFIKSLKNYHSSHEYLNTLNEALKSVLSEASPKDLILLSGAQGMDPAYSVLTHLKHNEN